jgi:tRNA modification GTPase
LLDALALIEAHIDFEDEDTEAVSQDDLRAALIRAREACDALLTHAAASPACDGETDVALLGPPNAGKSSLFLALCPGATTSVSPRAGTTRDMLEAHVLRDGRRYRILDGPGIAPDPTGAGTQPHDGTAARELDDLDRQAMESFLSVLPRAAVVLIVDDASAPASPAARAALRDAVPGRVVIPVWNKCDLPSPPVSRWEAERDMRPALAVSALVGTGLEDLWDAVASAAPAPRAPDLAGSLQRAAVGEARQQLDEALGDDLQSSLPLASFGLRDALAALDRPDPQAADVTEEVLDRVFAAFCLGK